MGLKDPNAALQAALAARDAGREEKGMAIIRAGLRRWPGDARFWQVLGLLERARQDSAAAMKALARAAAMAPGDARIAHGLARVTLEAGLPALALFERARSLAPNDPEILIGRASAQMAEGRLDEAIADLTTLMRRNPAWLEGHRLLSQLHWMAGEREVAMASYERGVAALPGNLDLWVAYIEAYDQAGMYAEADAVVAKARAALGDHIFLDFCEALCASETGDNGRADRLFARVADETDVRVATRHIRHLVRTGRPDQAVARATPYLATPDAHQVWPYVSIAWRLMGDSRWEWLEGDSKLVGVYELGHKLDLNGLASRLRVLHNTVHQPLGQSVRGGTQTDGPLFARIEPEIRALRAVIADTVKRHIASLKADPTHPVLGRIPRQVRFAGAWSVRLAGAGHHSNHIHPEGWYSSALYVALPEAEHLGPAPAGWLELGRPQAELGIDLPPFRTVEPKPGRLVLFPSIMWHGTVPFDDGERLSVAFDVAPPLPR